MEVECPSESLASTDEPMQSQNPKNSTNILTAKKSLNLMKS
jgi:hypothetical protein